MAAQSRDTRHPPGPDSRFADALRPLVDTALKCSVRHEPEFWAQTFAPILGPAIRLAVASAIRNMVQMLNQLLENSLSARSWRWRFEAWRTGRPFAEVVLLRTLIYRVEKVLLVSRDSGLLLASVSAPGISDRDSDLVSAMLTAIQEFIHDSFQLEQGDSIRQIQTGGFSLWVEPGPFAVLAAVIRGNAPVELRHELRAAVDLIHEELSSEIRRFQGDSGIFEQRANPIMEGCLQSRFQKRDGRSRWRVWVAAGLVAAALLFWGILKVRHREQWDAALAALRATPGIVLTRSAREHGKEVLEGLRDPYAATAESVLARKGVSPRDVSIRLQPFISLDPSLLVRRARATLDAPNTISASLDRQVLNLTGEASHAWIVNARNASPKLALAGIRELRTDRLRDWDLDARRSEIESVKILFDVGSAGFAPGEERLIDGLVPKLREWIAGTIAIGRVPMVQVIGHVDRTGSDIANSSLSDRRARRVMDILLAAGVPPGFVNPTGAGPYASGEEVPGVGSAWQRNVVFALSSVPGEAGGESH